MADSRLVIATVLAGIVLALSIFGMFGDAIPNTQMGGHASMAASHFGGLSASHVPGLVALGLSGAAFVESWGKRSYIVAGFLATAGILYTIHLAPFLGDHSIIAFPGPVVGLVFGHVILSLGIVKAIASAKTTVVQSLNR